jgi:hypothetical protein
VFATLFLGQNSSAIFALHSLPLPFWHITPYKNLVSFSNLESYCGLSFPKHNKPLN